MKLTLEVAASLYRLGFGFGLVSFGWFCGLIVIPFVLSAVVVIAGTVIDVVVWIHAKARENIRRNNERLNR